MNLYLQIVLDLLQKSEGLTADEKNDLFKAVKTVNSEMEITTFKLDRTEKVKRTTAILLEETIEELENKRRAIEVQNRELEIEAALERVRTVAMAMRTAGNLLDICKIVYTELHTLGFNELRNAMINIYNDEKGSFLNYDYAANSGQTVTVMPYNFHPLVEKQVMVTKNAKDAFFEFSFRGEELKQFRELRKNNGEQDDPKLEVTDALHYYFFSIGNGSIGISTYSGIADEKLALLKRFRNVFNLSYQRYIDIDLAEAQAREAEIELALERVRARTMAMHQSKELAGVIEVVFEQFIHVDIQVEHAGFILDYKEREDMHIWFASLQVTPSEINIPYFDSPHWNSFREAKAKGENFFANLLSFDLKNKFYQELFTWIPPLPEAARQSIFSKPALAISTVLLENVGLYIENYTGIPFSAEENAILMRFGNVFQQTYTRFLDLQKAEAQAREAKIEAALEKVRSRSLAMHKAGELIEVASVLRTEMGLLGVEELETSSIYILTDENATTECWYAIKDIRENNGKLVTDHMTLNLEETWVGRSMLSFYNSPEKQTSILMQGKNRKEWINYCATKSTLLQGYYGGEIPERTYHLLKFSNGYMGAASPGEISAESWNLLQRVTAVFSFAYTRFLDLQKAEAQAREAKIEAALERVRSKTMAMHNSNDVGDTVATMFNEFVALGIHTNRCGILIFKDADIAEVWTAKSNPEGKAVLGTGKLQLKEHQLLSSAFDAWYSKKPFHQYILRNDDLFQYYNTINRSEYYSTKFDMQSLPDKEYHSDFYFTEGAVFSFTKEQLSEESARIMKRFAGVFGQTYRRYLDLLKAEAQAREAQIEAALERVRSRTMAMQQSEELADAAYVLFEQLNQLGVTHERINIGIVNEENQSIDFWVTEQGGKKLNTKFSGRISEETTLSKAYASWKNGEKSLVIDLSGKELRTWLTFMENEIKIPFDKAYLHERRVQTAGFFSKGMLVVTSPEPLQEEALYLLEKFAGVFDLTYTRFNDLNISEAHAIKAEQDLVAIKEAKQKAEDALIELQAAQKQLVQSEKMASLGELTAGIAHEIQNPLNFMNNFSEINAELIAEMKSELRNGHNEEAINLAENIEENEKKINHHGRRADAIVKGMLQHSQASAGKKEPTNINALADEYLRLSYHGLRARDKSFNSALKTDFDASIEKINIIPQDIGRVLLNLFNNAFYTVNEKKTQTESGHIETPEYEPVVAISTKKTNGMVEISVSDNGNGIPQKLIDKIFQPFFTTKPTGQGTGLGLSLSYDIIKAHGGELKLETKQSEGSKFVIQLPLKEII